MMKSKHIESIDIAKGIGIILVVLGHLLDKGLFHDYIYSFHMPLFFFLSGLFINNEKELLVDLKNYFKTLFVPYFLFSVIDCLIYFFCFINKQRFRTFESIFIFWLKTP